MGDTIGVGVIGLGTMGRTHLSAYRAAAADGVPCEVVAVADAHPERLSGRGPRGGPGPTASSDQSLLFDPTRVRGYADAHALLADPGVHLVSICTHTDTHVDLALAALQARKHVLVEKPVALRSADVRRLADAARASGRLCMPAMCMRFWPGWAWLRDRVRDGSFGAVRSAAFQRLGSPPDWSAFYADVARSGGAMVDLHIHDADFIRWCFGEPTEVVSTGSARHITTLYRYAPGTGPEHVVAEGGQDLAPGFGFSMRYVVAFEHATADFDLMRSPTVRLSRQGRSDAVEVPAMGAYDAEIRHLLGTIAGGSGAEGLRATLDDAVRTTMLLEAERQSLDTGMPVRFHP